MLDFKKAFMSPTTGDNWKSSLAFIVGMSFSCTIIYQHTRTIFPAGLYAVIALLIAFLIIGFKFNFLHNEIHSNANLMPDWKNNTGKLFKQGFKGSLSIAFYSLPFIFYLAVVCLIIPMFIMFAHNIRTPYNLSETIIFYVPIFTFILLIDIVSLAFWAIYTENFKFSDLSFIKPLNLIKKNFKLFLMISILDLGLIALMLLISFLNYKRSLFATGIIFHHKEHYMMLARVNASIYIVFKLITEFITLWYGLFVLNILGQAYKIMKAKESTLIQQENV